jgi:hypothetical protein
MQELVKYRGVYLFAAESQFLMTTRFAAVVLILSWGAVIGLAPASGADIPAEAPKKTSSEALADNARTVLAAIVKAAEENQRLPERVKAGARGPFRRVGDDLTVYYVRAGAAAARRLPAEQAAPAYLLALGIALDDSMLVRSNLLTRTLWRKVEPDEARKRRLRVLGSPSLHGRHDLAQHFAVSAALTAAAGPEAAEAAGLLKEMLDSRGGSGFSFADLSADFAGIAFARRLLAKPNLLAGVEKSFAVADYVLPPKGLPEGLMAAEFAKQYGSLNDERFRRRQADIRKRLDALPGYQTPSATDKR